jgi:glycosyltransferase involved in cell wall biosynthesis
MLDMGFIPDIERICKLVPFTRQTLFFTATMPPEIRRITEQFLHNPVKVEVAKPASTVAGTLQQLVKTGREPHDKRDTLRRTIRAADSFKNAIIFCNRKREVAQLHRSLVRHGFNAAALHGDLDQSARTAALDSFRSGEVKLLIASDVAARGLDVTDCVVNRARQVSRLAPNKRIDHAVRAMKCLVEKKVSARLTIVGGGETESLLRRLVAELQIGDHVSFAGMLSEQDKDAQLRSAHVLLHTSQREGWGLNVIEANAMGTPAVVYPVAGLTESTLHGETGLVSEQETPESLAASLISLQQSPEKYEVFRLKAWERAKTLHWSRVLPQAVEWLESQASAKRAG